MSYMNIVPTKSMIQVRISPTTTILIQVAHIRALFRRDSFLREALTSGKHESVSKPKQFGTSIIIIS